MNESSVITCPVVIENFDANGCTTKKTSLKFADVVLGRDESRSIVLKVSSPTVTVKYVANNVQLHKRFLKDGKASITFKDHNVRLFISNCPPSKLLLFLKILSVKSEVQKHNIQSIKPRDVLLNGLPRQFEHISPLAVKDLNAAQSYKQNSIAKGKENCPPTPVSCKRKGDTSPNSQNKKPRGPRAVALSFLDRPHLTQEQRRVIDIVKSGRNLFFTGSAGTGKSFLLRKIISMLPPDVTFATASTGSAASHIGGITLHAFAGVGSGNGSLEQWLQKAAHTSGLHHWKQCRHLIIDEISMVDGDLFVKLEKFARIVRKSDKPFGGIQLILAGDFLQLPPVTKKNETKSFCFQTEAWRKCVALNVEITQVHRQSETELIDILNTIRVGRCTDAMTERLQSTASNNVEGGGIMATRLCTHTDGVDHINQLQLDTLQGNEHIFEAMDSDPCLVKWLNKQTPVLARIVLKVGAQVMLTKNLDVLRGLVNGARGVVVNFLSGPHGLPIVRFANGIEMPINQERWTIKTVGGLYLTRNQLPLKLAWALSIHKSQGMTLDRVEISLGRVFESGQTYVALSRARSLNGLRVLNFDRKCVRANPDVLKFYATFKKYSE